MNTHAKNEGLMLYIWICKALGDFNSFLPLAIKGGQAYYRTFGKYDKLKGRNLSMVWSLEVAVLSVLGSSLLGLSIRARHHSCRYMKYKLCLSPCPVHQWGTVDGEFQS